MVSAWFNIVFNLFLSAFKVSHSLYVDIQKALPAIPTTNKSGKLNQRTTGGTFAVRAEKANQKKDKEAFRSALVTIIMNQNEDLRNASIESLRDGSVMETALGRSINAQEKDLLVRKKYSYKNNSCQATVLLLHQ